jgi:secreted PhoX family phosphatase
MRNIITGFVAGALIVVAAAMSFTTSAASDAEQQMADRAEIDALMWRYVRSLDGYDPDGYAAVYTPDGQFGATKGHDALKKMVADLKQRRAENEAKGQKQPAMYHMSMNEHLEFLDRDHARLNAYWLTVFGSAGENVPVRVAAAGRSVDELVRSNGKWLIKTRNVAPQN